MFNEKRILGALMERSGVYADIYVDERAYTLIQLESGRIEKLERGEDAGVGLRVITPWKNYYASTNSFDETHLADLAAQLSRYMTRTWVIRDSILRAIDSKPRTRASLSSMETPPGSLAIEKG